MTDVRSDPTTSKGPRRRPVRLWPLLFLPLVGLLAGTLRATVGPGLPNRQSGVDVAVSALGGLVAGSFLMALIALGFLAARVSTRRFTIRSLVITVALVALALGLVRTCIP